MTTLADKAILSGADNRPPMLEKDMYDSWKSIMELYMMNRQHGRMILESVENGPLIWPSIEENGVTRPKKYSELSATEAIQADCDIKATNIILQGLPPEVYALVSNHKVAKELWARIQLLMQGTSLTKQERECKLYDEFDKFAYKKGETLHVKLVRDLHTTNVDQLYAYLGQHEFHANEGRQTSLAVGTTRTYTPRASGRNSGKQRTVIYKVLLVQAQVSGQILHEEELAFLADPGILEGQATQTRMRIEQYIRMIDFALWEVIENGNTAPKTIVVKGVKKVIPPTNAEEKDQKRLEVKARKKRFGGNAATKKTQRNLLKLQKLVSQLELLGEMISQEDVNQKLLRSLSFEWNTHAIVWRNKAELETMNMDDLYNNLKVYEAEVKGMSNSSLSTQNMDFVSSSNNNSDSSNQVVNTAQTVNTAYGVFTAITQVNTINSSNVDNLSDVVIYAFLV
ncbi:hypothetical protein Tco_0877053 [Tanacetum coccineum]|uniref:Uncharacterized protein n=1 Tax=Tanacetum coccineum TaxID=301880 RepID=A0ABQ5BWY5_9ASTR